MPLIILNLNIAGCFPAGEDNADKESQTTTFVLDDVGCLVARENSGISGKVHVVKQSNQLWITNFNFDGKHTGVHFNIGWCTQISNIISYQTQILPFF